MEAEPGDMIRNPAKVYAEAEATAAQSAAGNRLWVALRIE